MLEMNYEGLVETQMSKSQFCNHRLNCTNSSNNTVKSTIEFHKKKCDYDEYKCYICVQFYIISINEGIINVFIICDDSNQCN